MPLINLPKLKKDDGQKNENVPDELPSLPGTKSENSLVQQGAQISAVPSASPSSSAQPAPSQTMQPQAAQASPSQPPGQQMPSPLTLPVSPTVNSTRSSSDTLALLKESSQQYQTDIISLREHQGLAPDELPPLADSAERVAASQVTMSYPTTLEQISSPGPLLAQQQVVEQSTESNINIQKTDQKLYFSELFKRFHDKTQQGEVSKEILATASEQIISTLSTKWHEEKEHNLLEELDQKIMRKMAPLQTMEKQWRQMKAELDTKSAALKEKENEIKQTTLDLRDLLSEKMKYLEQHSHSS